MEETPNYGRECLVNEIFDDLRQIPILSITQRLISPSEYKVSPIWKEVSLVTGALELHMHFPASNPALNNSGIFLHHASFVIGQPLAECHLGFSACYD